MPCQRRTGAGPARRRQARPPVTANLPTLQVISVLMEPFRRWLLLICMLACTIGSPGPPRTLAANLLPGAPYHFWDVYYSWSAEQQAKMAGSWWYEITITVDRDPAPPSNYYW